MKNIQARDLSVSILNKVTLIYKSVVKYSIDEISMTAVGSRPTTTHDLKTTMVEIQCF